MAYMMSEEEQRQRIIELVRQEKDEDCPRLVVERIEKAMHQVTVLYWCREEDTEEDELLRGLVLNDEQAEYIGVHESNYGGP